MPWLSDGQGTTLKEVAFQFYALCKVATCVRAQSKSSGGRHRTALPTHLQAGEEPQCPSILHLCSPEMRVRYPLLCRPEWDRGGCSWGRAHLTPPFLRCTLSYVFSWLSIVVLMLQMKSRKYRLITRQIKWQKRNMHSREKRWDSAAPEEKLTLLPSASLSMSICQNCNCLKIFQMSAEESDGRVFTSWKVKHENLWFKYVWTYYVLPFLRFYLMFGKICKAFYYPL